MSIVEIFDMLSEINQTISSLHGQMNRHSKLMKNSGELPIEIQNDGPLLEARLIDMLSQKEILESLARKTAQGESAQDFLGQDFAAILAAEFAEEYLNIFPEAEEEKLTEEENLAEKAEIPKLSLADINQRLTEIKEMISTLLRQSNRHQELIKNFGYCKLPIDIQNDGPLIEARLVDMAAQKQIFQSLARVAEYDVAQEKAAQEKAAQDLWAQDLAEEDQAAEEDLAAEENLVAQNQDSEPSEEKLGAQNNVIPKALKVEDESDLSEPKIEPFVGKFWQ